MPTQMMNAKKVGLTRQEKSKLTQLEDVIETANRWAIEQAKALAEIRQGKLYREHYTTFEEYAEDRWGYDRSYLYRIASWGEVITNVLPIGSAPQRESHARPLYGLSVQQQRDCWNAVVRQQQRRGGTTTAETVAGAVAVVIGHQQSRATPPTAGGKGKIVHGDCLKMIPTLPDRSVDLFLFSPPYCEQRNDYYPGIPEKGYPSWMARVMNAIQPKLGENGNVLIIAREHLVGGQISDVWLRARLAIRDTGFRECETLIWSKPDAPPLGSNDRPRRSFEYIFWFSPSKKPFIDTRACGTEAIDGQVRLHESAKVKRHGKTFARFAGIATSRVTDVFHAPVAGICRGIDHPSMKPQLLADQLVRTFSPAGGLCADPFVGSGTSLLAAQAAGRNWWGCDVVQRYVQLANRRLSI